MFDYVILGGGLAGLTMAHALSKHPTLRGSISILEARGHYTNDKTWCHWRTVDHPFDHLVDKRWTRWRISSTDESIVQVSEACPYQRLQAIRFYEFCLDHLARQPAVYLSLETHVESIDAREDRVVIDTDRGRIEGRYVFDARSAPEHFAHLSARRDFIIQRFWGYDVECEASLFDPTCVHLMDFTMTQRRGLAFAYTLPESHHRAMVEITYYENRWPSDTTEADARHDLDDYLAAQLERAAGRAAGVEVTLRERGVLPMHVAKTNRHPHKRIYTLGALAGLVRPSSGYSFMGTHRYTQSLLERFTREPFPEPPQPYSALSTFLDGVLLRILHREPHQAASIFTSLAALKGETLARFLNDESWPALLALVVRARPLQPFLSHVFGGRSS